MTYHLPDRIIYEITKYARAHHIQKIILFGSRANGTNTERSDIDIAVSGGDFDAFYWDIKENVDSLLMFDVVDLDSGVSDELTNEINRNGVIIYEKA